MKEKIKSKKNRWVFLVVLIAIVGIAAYLFISTRKAINFVLPDLKQITFISANIHDGKAKGAIRGIVQNKSPYRLTIDSVQVTIYLGSDTIVHEQIGVGLAQDRYQTDTIALPVELDIRSIRGTIQSLQGQDSVNIRADIGILYNTFIGHRRLQFHKEAGIPVPIPPKIRILKIENKKYHVGSKELSAMLTVEIVNRGKNLDMVLCDVHYKFVIDNILNAEGLAAKELRIKPQSNAVVRIPVSIALEHPLKTAWNIATDKDRYDYKLTLKGCIKGSDGDTSLIPVEVNADGKAELMK